MMEIRVPTAFVAIAFLLGGCASKQLQPTVTVSEASRPKLTAVATADTTKQTSPGDNPDNPIGHRAMDDPERNIQWLWRGVWARLGSTILLAPSDEIAKFGYQEITFLPGGRYEWQGWYFGVNFKKAGHYEDRGESIFMQDKEWLWQKGGDIKGLIWNDEPTYAKYRVTRYGPVLEPFAGSNWVYFNDWRYDWRRHLVVNRNGEVIKFKNE